VVSFEGSVSQSQWLFPGRREFLYPCSSWFWLASRVFWWDLVQLWEVWLYAGCLLVLDCEKCWAWVALFCWVFWWFACSIGYFFFAFLLFGSNQLIFLSVIRELLVLQLITFRLKTRDKQVCILFSKYIQYLLSSVYQYLLWKL
jgi:hypothetical protein